MTGRLAAARGPFNKPALTERGGGRIPAFEPMLRRVTETPRQSICKRD